MLQWGATGALALSFAPLLAACSSDPRQLKFLNWQDYIDRAMLRDFEAAYDAGVTYETYASNDELAAVLAAAAVSRRRGRKGKGVDLVVPSENLLRRLRDNDELARLDPDIVTEQLLDHLEPSARTLPADPGNRYSVPWATGTTGIGYDTTVFASPPDWSVFLDTAYRGRMSLLDERREAFAAALRSLDEDPNSRDAAVVKRAATQLAKMLEAAELDSATYLDRLASGDLVVAQAFNTDLLQAKKRNPKLGFVIPEAGGSRWIDSLCIPSDAPNRKLANQFIAFSLDPKVSAQNAAVVQVDTANTAARAFMSDELLANTVIFPTDAELERVAFLEDLGDDEQLYRDAWDSLDATA